MVFSFRLILLKSNSEEAAHSVLARGMLAIQACDSTSLPPDQSINFCARWFLPIMITVACPYFSSFDAIYIDVHLLPKQTAPSVHFCSTSSMPILLRFRGERSRLSSLSSSLSELRCAPAIAAVEGVS